MVEDQAKFAAYRALFTPLVEITNVEISPGKKNSKNWNVTATVANTGYLDTSMQQARNARIAKPDVLTLKLPENASTKDSLDVEFPYMRGTRGSSFVNKYRGAWNIDASAGTKVTVIIRSEKGGVDREEVILR